MSKYKVLISANPPTNNYFSMIEVKQEDLSKIIMGLHLLEVEFIVKNQEDVEVATSTGIKRRNL